MKKLVVILPCYNEEEILPRTIQKMKKLMTSLIKSKAISDTSRICFVDDGSRDATWTIISQTCRKDKLFSALKLSRNFGHQSAILAGMYDVSADIYVTIDADLQDDPDCIPQMLDALLNQGCDIVYGVRNSRKSDSFLNAPVPVYIIAC